MTPPYITPQRAFTTAKEYIVMIIIWKIMQNA